MGVILGFINGKVGLGFNLVFVDWFGLLFVWLLFVVLVLGVDVVEVELDVLVFLLEEDWCDEFDDDLLFDDVFVVLIFVFFVEIFFLVEGEVVFEFVGCVFFCFFVLEEFFVDVVVIVRFVFGLIVFVKVIKGDDSDKIKVDNNKVVIIFCFDIY